MSNSLTLYFILLQINWLIFIKQTTPQSKGLRKLERSTHISCHLKEAFWKNGALKISICESCQVKFSVKILQKYLLRGSFFKDFDCKFQNTYFSKHLSVAVYLNYLCFKNRFSKSWISEFSCQNREDHYDWKYVKYNFR